eukprot:11179322-Lingulodinium_polyedra.AAC.1
MQRVTPAGCGSNLCRRGQGLYARLLHAPDVSVGTKQALPRRCPSSDISAQQRDAGARVAGLTHRPPAAAGALRAPPGRRPPSHPDGP